MGATYSKEFQEIAVAKLLARGGRSMSDVSRELGISNSSAYCWLRESGKVLSLMDHKHSKSSKEWSVQEKFQAVVEFEGLKSEPAKQGEFLRKAGLHASLVESWRKEILGALAKTMGRRGSAKRAPEEIAKDNKIAALERDLNRKNRALAETTALLVLKKKAESIWGLVDDEEEK